MDLEIRDKLFLVTGATSGFGKAIALALASEGARIILNARGEDKLQAMVEGHRDHMQYVTGDITTDATITQVLRLIGGAHLAGAVINAGGPPAKSFVETEISDWDDAYRRVLRWKVKLVNFLLPRFTEQSYGRIVLIESVSVKQPIENLVLSNAFRLAVIGFAKTLSQEIAKEGITVNVIAPGYHATPAMERLFTKRANMLGIDLADAQKAYVDEISSGHLGQPADLASLATWLLSPKAGYVTGQTLVVDGGLSKGVM